MCRPGEMLGDERGLVAIDEMPRNASRCAVSSGRGAADRHAYAMQRERMVAAYRLERPVRRTACAHVVLGVDLEEAARLRPREDRLQMLRLEACPGRSRRSAAPESEAERCPARDVRLGLSSWSSPFSGRWRAASYWIYIAVSEPCLPFGTSIEAQVPPWTNFHELAWKSTVEVPWQVVPGPAAQSFWPLSATPKHFSLWAADGGGLFRVGQRARRRPGRERARQGAGEDERGDGGSCRHYLLRIAGWPSLGALGLRGWSRERYVDC